MALLLLAKDDMGTTYAAMEYTDQNSIWTPKEPKPVSDIAASPIENLYNCTLARSCQLFEF